MTTVFSGRVTTGCGHGPWARAVDTGSVYRDLGTQMLHALTTDHGIHTFNPQAE